MLFITVTLSSQTFDVDSIETNIEHYNVPNIVIINDDIIKIGYKNTCEFFIVDNFWNQKYITWYSLSDIKRNVYSATLTKINNSYYVLNITCDSLDIVYHLKRCIWKS